MDRALLFTACALLSVLCSPYALGETLGCFLCLMDYRGSGCLTGSHKCIVDPDKGQACLTVHVSYQGTEIYRMEGCTDVMNCGKTHTVGDYSVHMTCCTHRENCN